MTVAALEAEKLGELLAARQAAALDGQAGLAGLSWEYQHAIISIIQQAWDLSVGEYTMGSIE